MEMIDADESVFAEFCLENLPMIFFSTIFKFLCEVVSKFVFRFLLVFGECFCVFGDGVGADFFFVYIILMFFFFLLFCVFCQAVS